MKRILAVLLSLMLLLAAVPAGVSAYTDEEKGAADRLNRLGLFQGTGTKADGTPEYSLDKSMNRAEAVTMLVRLLGKEDEAKAGSYSIPFTDVPQWAKPYVGYAYANGLTKGLSSKAFGSASPVTTTQYLTFVLRALGYESGTDFEWSSAWNKSDELGITWGEYGPWNNSSFDRGNAVTISSDALDTYMKESDMLLLELATGSPVEYITVSSVKDLLNAIGSNRVIELTSGEYNLTTADSMSLLSDCVYREDPYDGYEYVIGGVYNMTIQAAYGAEVTICVEPRYANVLSFVGCYGIYLQNLTIGHTVEQGTCTGGVIYADGCSGLTIDGCYLYGCGTYGLETHGCDSVLMCNSTIHDCSYGIMDLYDSSDLTFENCSFFYNEFLSMLNFNYVQNAVFHGCEFYENNCEGYAFISADGYSTASFTGCRFRSNVFGSLCGENSGGIRISPECIIYDNQIANW